VEGAAVSAQLSPSGKTDYTTPPDLFAALDEEFGFTLDAAASNANALCERYFTEDDDGLAQDWSGDVVWCNPPYGARETAMWARKAAAEAERGATVVLLVPARPDTRWWHECIEGKHEVRNIRGRLRFGGGYSVAPFAAVLVVMRPSGTSRRRTGSARKCDGCGRWMVGRRSHARACSDTCRKRIRRQRVTKKRDHIKEEGA
jgi:phage N-6-adenine-methyltransferase